MGNNYYQMHEKVAKEKSKITIEIKQISFFKQLAKECGLEIGQEEWRYIETVFYMLRSVDNTLDNPLKPYTTQKRLHSYERIINFLTKDSVIKVGKTLSGKIIDKIELLKSYYNEMGQTEKATFLKLLKRVFEQEEVTRRSKATVDYSIHRIQYAELIGELAFFQVRQDTSLETYNKSKFLSLAIHSIKLAKLKNSWSDFDQDRKLKLVPNFNRQDFVQYLRYMYVLNLLRIPFVSGVTAPLTLLKSHMKNNKQNSLPENQL
jgi:hypothetical protein